MMLCLAAAAALACSNGKRTYESGGVDTTADSSRVSVPDIDVGLKKDTVNVPVLGTEKDTVVITKPVIKGRKPVEIAHPTVDVKKKP
jgi:hypothetical protein